MKSKISTLRILKIPNAITIILTLFIVVANWETRATPVNADKAINVANAFLNQEKARWNSDPRTVPETFKVKGLKAASQAYLIRDVRAVEDNGLVSAYIAELQPEGFVIISGDDEIEPVLGFSFHGQFPFTESGHNALLHLVKWDTGGRLQALQAAKAKGTITKQTNPASEKWASYLSAAKTGGAKPLTPSPMTIQQWPPNKDGWLPQPTWNQTPPYNNECPYISPNGTVYSTQGNGNRCWVGCTATAFSQIVNYWQYPNQVLFSSADDYTSKGDAGTFDIDKDSATWGFPTFAQLNSALSSINYDGDNTEVAYLSFAAGVKLKEQYGNQGSSAPLSDQAYKSGFSYGSAHLDSSIIAWTLEQARVIENIKKGWPVQIGIRGFALANPPIDGHSIIIDGYLTDGANSNYHLNFGWGGSGDAWYNLPGIGTVGEYNWQLIWAVVDDISPYQGWSQVGADAVNSYRSYYSAPSATPITKWQVSTNALTYLFSGVVVGAGNRVYAFLNSTALSASSQVWVIDQFGTVLQEVSLPSAENNQYLSAPVQAANGNVFVGTQLGNIYELNPNTYALAEIFSDPNQRIIGAPLKTDANNNLYVTANRLNQSDGDRLYCLSSSNTVLWTFAPPTSETLDVGQPAVDDSNNRVFISSLNQSAQTSYVYELNLTNGTVETKALFSNNGTVSAEGPISLGPDGTPFIVINSTLYALNPSNSLSVKWSNVYSGETAIGMSLAIGLNGTIYVPLRQSSSVVALVSLNPASGAQNWQISLPAAANDFIVEPYVTVGGLLVFSQHHFNAATFTHFGYQDNGSSATPLWAYNTSSYSGSKAFGPGDTIYLFPYNSAGQTITAISDGAVGDPEGAGMAFVNNEPPNIPSIVSPLDGTNGLGTSVTLSWQCSDSLGHSLFYNLSVCPIIPGNDGVFIPITNGLTTTSFTFTNLAPGVKYLWNVVASDGQAIAAGPIWAFTTQPLPQLAISKVANSVVISWSTNATGFMLESTTNLSPSSVWSQVSTVPAIFGTNNVVTNSIVGKTMFYRLSQ